MLAWTQARAIFAENPHRITQTATLGGHVVLGSPVTSVRLAPVAVSPVLVTRPAAPAESTQEEGVIGTPADEQAIPLW